jgi:hypothetical protein
MNECSSNLWYLTRRRITNRGLLPLALECSSVRSLVASADMKLEVMLTYARVVMVRALRCRGTLEVSSDIYKPETTCACECIEKR